jgi:hypothetical protein
MLLLITPDPRVDAGWVLDLSKSFHETCILDLSPNLKFGEAHFLNVRVKESTPLVTFSFQWTVFWMVQLEQFL